MVLPGFKKYNVFYHGNHRVINLASTASKPLMSIMPHRLSRYLDMCRFECKSCFSSDPSFTNHISIKRKSSNTLFTVPEYLSFPIWRLFRTPLEGEWKWPVNDVAWTSGLAGVSTITLRDWGPRDPSDRWLETVGDMTPCIWRSCIRSSFLLSNFSNYYFAVGLSLFLILFLFEWCCEVATRTR